MSFSNPAWLPAGLLACLCLLWLWSRYDARQHAALARFVSAHLRVQLTQSVSIGRRRVQRVLTLAALALLFVALAGPLVGYRWEQISRRGIEIVFALDTSRSMSTPDVKPDRLTRAKLGIDDFTNELDGDAIGLVAFAGRAFLACPITLDYGAFHESLSAIDINTIPRGGTNIASAIREAQAALRRRPGSDKILVLVTDGEDLEGDALIAAQTAARQDSLKIYTIGVGTAQGDLIPLSADRNAGFVKDDSGAFVKSRLDEPALKAIAAATGGQYAALGTQGQGFETIYNQSLAPLLKHDLASRQQKVYTQRYQGPLAGSLALLLLSLLIGTRRRSARRRDARPESQRAVIDTAAASGLILLLLSLAPVGPLRASTASAEAAYKKGDFATAAHDFAEAAQHDPGKPALQFNAGTAEYRAGQFPQAAQAFQQSISRAVSGSPERLADQEDAYYNLGNTLYRSGQNTEASDPKQTLQTWAQSVKAYDAALELRANDADSKFNRDFVKRKIEELKNKQSQPPPQQNQQNNQQNNQQQNQQQNQPQNPQQKPPQNGQQSPPGQPPPSAGQQPPGQPPPGQQPPPNQPPPNAGQPPPNQPPPNAGQPPPNQPPPSAGQPPPGQPPPSAGQPKPAPGNEPPPAAGGGDQDDTQRSPGQMTREEARELLDSQKGDERHALGLPVARRDMQTPPDKPVRDW